MTRIIPKKDLEKFIKATGYKPSSTKIKKLKTSNISRILISIIFSIMAIVHLIFPEIKIDITTIALITIAFLPWFNSIIKTVELPGGFKIELQDVKSATEKVNLKKSNLHKSELMNNSSTNVDYLKELSFTDPNLSLVGLRIEIEKKLNLLTNNEHNRRSAGFLLKEIVNKGLIDIQTAKGLSELIALGNQAAHGIEVSQNAAIWALDNAYWILESLDEIVIKSNDTNVDRNLENN